MVRKTFVLKAVLMDLQRVELILNYLKKAKQIVHIKELNDIQMVKKIKWLMNVQKDFDQEKLLKIRKNK